MPETISSNQPTEPKDIFAEVEMAPPEVKKPIEPIKIVVEPQKIRSKFNWRILLYSLIVVILIALIYITYPFIKSFFEKPATIRETKPATQVTEQQKSVAPVVQVIDTDGDGLSDSEELSLGTNPKQTDTDKDGLFDKEEIRIYKTNPLKADTDGDGVVDGQEVKRGEDPNNPTPGAKLLDLEKEIEKLK